MKVGKTLKLIVLLDVVLVIYVILTSVIISYRSEEKVADIMIDSFKKWSLEKFDVEERVIEREKRLSTTFDEKLATRLGGSVLLQVESQGETWYVSPMDSRRSYLGRPREAFALAKKLSVEIENEDLIKYLYFDKIFPDYLAGYFVVDSEDEDDLYYIHPQSWLGYKLKDPDQAWRVLKEQGLGITNENIRKIEVGEIK